MRPISSKCLVLALLICTLSSKTLSQDQSPAANPATSAAASDRFLGPWKLNTDKTAHSGIRSETITIELQGMNFKFTYDTLAENGTESHWSCVTDMKGSVVKPAQVNGQPMNGKSRITRIDSGAFKEESAVVKDEYKVSADGKTLKLNRTFLVKTYPQIIPEKVQLLFERIG